MNHGLYFSPSIPIHFINTYLFSLILKQHQHVICNAAPRVRRKGAGPLSCIEMLLEHGADIDAQNADGETPLHIAVRINHRPAMAMLVSKGCAVRVGDAEGRTAYQLAIHLNR
jgi:ankyrin repeat protein